MKCFLSSDPTIGKTINPANGFLKELKAAILENACVLFVASDPDGYGKTDFYSGILKHCFENAGFRFRSFTTLDHRNHLDADSLVRNADFIILAGGHVPTQNRFFQEINLQSLLKEFHGVLLGISAGSINSAETVYAHPEREGETVDPNFLKFLPGLGLTKCMLLPHYQAIKDDILDGLRVFEDIAYPDSMGRSFLCLVDGSYVLSCDEGEQLYGEAYRIKDGELTQIAVEGDVIQLL